MTTVKRSTKTVPLLGHSVYYCSPVRLSVCLVHRRIGQNGWTKDFEILTIPIRTDFTDLYLYWIKGELVCLF